MKGERISEEELLQAEALLEERVAGNDSAQVANLRQAIADRRRAIEDRLRSEWLEAFRVARHECILGQHLRGLEQVLDLP